MGKVRVFELAKKLGMSNQDVIAKLSAHGVVVKTHSSSIDENMALKAMKEGKVETHNAAPVRRTVLRRRKVVENEPVQVQTTPEVVSPVPAEPLREEPAVVVAKPAAIDAPPVEQKTEAPQEIVTPAQETAAVPAATQKEATATPEAAPAVPATPAAGEAPAVAAAAPEAPKPVAKKINRNVVRVIDASAIRARLAGEGRKFGPRPPRGPGGPGRGPRPGAPRPGGPSAAGFAGPRPTQLVDLPPAGGKGGPRPGKKKSGKGGRSFGDKKERYSGGGYELWASPSKRGRKKFGRVKESVTEKAAAHKRVVELTGPISVNDLAHKMSIKAGQVVQKLMGMGMMVTVNQAIDPDTATLVASEFEYEVKNVAFEEDDLLQGEVVDTANHVARAPVVTVMGHVDHGKTSILDALRKKNVASGEAGGITQHIGAYSVETKFGPITFLDTPGHAAFTAMRARGAKVTDIVVLVVAADDGVMPQTLEAIDHAKAAGVPVIVAINKMDIVDAKPERVMQQLSERGIVAEEWGGEAQMFKVSALKKQGLDELIEGICNLAEISEFKADPDGKAVGSVVEARLDKGRGPVATILVQGGKLCQGDHVVAGEFAGRVRAMYDSHGNKVKEAGPSTPVEVLGISGVPTAGDAFNAAADDKTAKTIAEHRKQKVREKVLFKSGGISLENFLEKTKEKDTQQTLELVVKADVFGSVEALKSSLEALSTKEVKIDVIHSGVGTITENDVNLALTSKAIVIGFGVKPDTKAQELASQGKVDVRLYRIIYEMLDEIKTSMAGLLAPIFEENYLGKAEVRAVFPVGKTTKIAGSYVQDGKILRAAKVRVMKSGKMVFEGDFSGLKRFKDDVKEVASGYECGILIDGFDDLEEGDIIECFELKEIAAELGEALIDQKKEEPKEEKDSSAEV